VEWFAKRASEPPSATAFVTADYTDALRLDVFAYSTFTELREDIMIARAHRCTVGRSSLFAIFVFVLVLGGGCKRDDSSIGPYDSPTYPLVAGHWVGTGTNYRGGVNVFAVVGEFTQSKDSLSGQIGGSFSGTLVWSYSSHYSCTVTIMGEVTTSNTVSMQEINASDVGWVKGSMSGLVSSKGDSMGCVRPMLSKGDQVGVLALVKH
jgi:hypothetical protein